MIDIGFDGGKRPRLVVVRPFVPGEPADDARRHIDPLFSVLADLAGSTGRTEIHQDLIADYASPWLTPGERELTVAALAGDRRGLVRAMDDHLDDLRASALRLTRPGEAMIYHGDLHGRNLLTDGSGSPTVIDWDETGYSQRPADAGKALWLSCRRGRGTSNWTRRQPVDSSNTCGGAWVFRLRRWAMWQNWGRSGFCRAPTM